MKQTNRMNKRIHVLGGAAIILGAILVGLILSVFLSNNHRVRASQTTGLPTVTLISEMIPTNTTVLPTETMMPSPVVPSAIPTVQPTALSAADWKNWPILPERISTKMIDVYRAGQENGNKANRFSKVGDSNSIMPSFLGCFDYGENGYKLGKYTDLEETIKQFQWSFSRESRATANGITAMQLDTYHWYEDDVCWPYESATSCEYRLWQPSIAFIALGTNDVYMPLAEFDKHMRSLVQKSIDRYVVPILVTKADNLEGDGSFNQAIAQIALDYEVPLWNLWRAMDPLPGHGLRENDVHPTFNNTSLCDFSGDDLKTYGWTVRNLTGLQALDRVWHLLNQGVTSIPQ